MLALLALIPVQEAPPASPSPAQLEEVEVVGRRGAARVAPEQELGPEEIDNLGAYDIGEVIARLSERLGFQQPPVVIVNGRPLRNVPIPEMVHPSQKGLAPSGSTHVSPAARL